MDSWKGGKVLFASVSGKQCGATQERKVPEALESVLKQVTEFDCFISHILFVDEVQSLVNVSETPCEYR